MERHPIRSNQVDWPNLIRHVTRDRVMVELTNDDIPVARLVPIDVPSSLSQLENELRKLPSLGEDAVIFEADVADIRESMLPIDDPWTS